MLFPITQMASYYYRLTHHTTTSLYNDSTVAPDITYFTKKLAVTKVMTCISNKPFNFFVECHQKNFPFLGLNLISSSNQCLQPVDLETAMNSKASFMLAAVLF